ncbi:unnamed protein product [Cylindrotheca closterium]|uniref:DUF6824 domain-containing protein n=1 Tax=Cylindrotheca closterium TaxID=2856 RepID=A0AAD2FZ66_9STRA|nr:unnamed protein product [Cylindrotheca closterium]
MASSPSYPNIGMRNTGGFQSCFGCDKHGSPPRIPQYDTRPEMKSTEDFLASEMNKLSAQERSKALDELHCVGEELKETPEMVRGSLEEFDRVLRERDEAIYNLAESQNRSYVEDPEFRLRFLRVNDHNANQSVNQMIGFLSCKETYFGREKVARDITLNDLDKEDVEVMLSGLYHIQDDTDRNGRLVVHLMKHTLERMNTNSVIRVVYFIYFNILSSMPSVQAKGFVFCYYDFSTPDRQVPLPSLDRVLKTMDFVKNIPVRRSAMHFCLKAFPGRLAATNLILESIFRNLQRSASTRARLHYGSDIELQYSLRSYGLKLETFPVDTAGNLRRDILNVWVDKYVGQYNRSKFASASQSTLSLSERDDSKEMMATGNDHAVDNWAILLSDVGSSLSAQQTEAQIVESSTTTHNAARSNSASATNGLIIEPSPNDVLLGRGRGSQRHPGNVRFREFLKVYQDDYNNAQRYKRVNTPTELTRILLQDGMRFLKKADGGWVESDFAEVEKKVKQVFRTRKKMMKKSDGTGNDFESMW